MRMFALRRLAVTAALLLAATTAAAAQRFLSDITGKWKVAVSMGGNTSESFLTVKQSGDTLSGVIETEQAGSRPIVGTVSKDTVRFEFAIDMQGTALEIRAGGLLKDNDSIEGEFVLPNGMGSFPFTAKRQP
jgi:ABC-type sugar transport system substrate-binding protein